MFLSCSNFLCLCHIVRKNRAAVCLDLVKGFSDVSTVASVPVCLQDCVLLLVGFFLQQQWKKGWKKEDKSFMKAETFHCKISVWLRKREAYVMGFLFFLSYLLSAPGLFKKWSYWKTVFPVMQPDLDVKRCLQKLDQSQSADQVPKYVT